MNLLEHAHRCAYQSGDIPTRRAHTVHQLATLLTRRLPVTLEALRLEHAELDGYAATASGADRGGSSSKGSVSRPVEACVLARDRDGHGITPDHNDLSEHVLTASDTTNRAWNSDNPDDIDDWLNVATIALRQAHRICDRHNLAETRRRRTSMARRMNADRCPHELPCRGLFSACVTEWLQGPPIGTPESLRLGRLMHLAIHPTPYCHLHGCES